jgi:hypothetical protein
LEFSRVWNFDMLLSATRRRTIAAGRRPLPPRRRPGGFGDDIFNITGDSTGGLFSDTTPAPLAIDTTPPASLFTPTDTPIALLPPSLSPAAPGLSTNDLIPPSGSISVTGAGNVINSSGQIIGIVDPSTGKVVAEPSYRPGSTSGALLDVSNLAANVGKAVSSLFGAKPVSGSGASVPGAPLIAGVPNSYLMIGAAALGFVLLASGGGRRR